MPQPKITSFIKTGARTLSSENVSPNVLGTSKRSPEKRNETPTKKPKMDSEQGDVNPAPLTPEQRHRMTESKTKCEIIQLAKKLPGALDRGIGVTWFQALKPEFEKPFFKDLNEFLVKERATNVPIFPPGPEVWSWTHHFDIKATKVVILGQGEFVHP